VLNICLIPKRSVSIWDKKEDKKEIERTYFFCIFYCFESVETNFELDCLKFTLAKYLFVPLLPLNTKFLKNIVL
jgi:hypothetical protein